MSIESRVVNTLQSKYGMSSEQASLSANTVAAGPTDTGFFGHLTVAPPNAIFLTGTQFKADTDPRRINLGVGAYRDDSGKPFVLNVVKKAELSIQQDTSLNHEYLPIGGFDPFVEAARTLLFGAESEAVKSNRIASIQSISGTGSLGVGAAFLKKFYPESEVLISSPTWGNHKDLFVQAGFKTIGTYRYWHAAERRLDIDGFLTDLRNAKPKTIVLLHACAHNPTGVDPTPAQWAQICAVVKARGLIPYMDSAYQGFATGDLEADAQAVRYFVSQGLEVMASQSFAKNLGLYNERIGGFHIVCRDAAQAKAVRSQVLLVVRHLYSNPPAHGAHIVHRILTTPTLYQEWTQELKGMSHRIIDMRNALKSEFLSLGTPGNWDHITSQIGMFSFTGLTVLQCKELKKNHHIYLLDNGRISMAGLNTKNVKYFASCVDNVVRNIK